MDTSKNKMNLRNNKNKDDTPIFVKGFQRDFIMISLKNGCLHGFGIVFNAGKSN